MANKNENSDVIETPLAKLLGPTLQDSSNNEKPTSEALKDTAIVALYFSASW